jgi:hypothetical protein
VADSTANQVRATKTTHVFHPGNSLTYPAGAIHIYKGDLLMVLRGTGYAVLAANTALGQFIGVAEEECDNSGGSAGDLSVTVRKGIYKIAKGSAAVTDIGVFATAVDSDTVATGGTKNVVVGRIIGFVSTTHVWVDMYDVAPDSEAS